VRGKRRSCLAVARQQAAARACPVSAVCCECYVVGRRSSAAAGKRGSTRTSKHTAARRLPAAPSHVAAPAIRALVGLLRHELLDQVAIASVDLRGERGGRALPPPWPTAACTGAGGQLCQLCMLARNSPLLLRHPQPEVSSAPRPQHQQSPRDCPAGLTSMPSKPHSATATLAAAANSWTTALIAASPGSTDGVSYGTCGASTQLKQRHPCHSASVLISSSGGGPRCGMHALAHLDAAIHVQRARHGHS